MELLKHLSHQIHYGGREEGRGGGGGTTGYTYYNLPFSHPPFVFPCMKRICNTASAWISDGDYYQSFQCLEHKCFLSSDADGEDFAE